MIRTYLRSLFSYAPSTNATSTNATSTNATNLAANEHFSPMYRSIRTTLDNTYHETYSISRQKLQDQIVTELLSQSAAGTTVAANAAEATNAGTTSSDCQWIIFTAGCMGAGKSYTIRTLLNSARFRHNSIVWVDPDTIRCYLPEFAEYCKHEPQIAGQMTNKESGYIAEILTHAALMDGKHVIVDGSLRDHAWHSVYFDRLRSDYHNLRIAIISVTAPFEDVLRRVEERAIRTGRVVPIDILMDSFKTVPISVNILKSKVDLFVEFTNRSDDGEIKIVVEGSNKRYGLNEFGTERDQAWAMFEQIWKTNGHFGH